MERKKVKNRLFSPEQKKDYYSRRFNNKKLSFYKRDYAEWWLDGYTDFKDISDIKYSESFLDFKKTMYRRSKSKEEKKNLRLGILRNRGYLNGLKAREQEEKRKSK